MSYLYIYMLKDAVCSHYWDFIHRNLE